MPTVTELSDPYANFMLAPRHGPSVCRSCFNLTDGYARCFACAHGGDSLAAVAPVSYSIAGEQLHHALASYKRVDAEWARALTRELAAVLWRHLARHERCLARAAGVERFGHVTTVPSSDPARVPAHPLEQIVGRLVGPTRERHATLLRRTSHPVALHSFDPDRFAATTALAGEPILLIDDTWTTGASAQSAAAALRRAGAGPVVAVVLGRHLNRDWGDNDRRLRTLPTPFDWSRCAYCAAAAVADDDDERERPDPAAMAAAVDESDRRRPTITLAGVRSAPPGAEHPAPVLPGDR